MPAATLLSLHPQCWPGTARDIQGQPGSPGTPCAAEGTEKKHSLLQGCAGRSPAGSVRNTHFLCPQCPGPLLCPFSAGVQEHSLSSGFVPFSSCSPCFILHFASPLMQNIFLICFFQMNLQYNIRIKQGETLLFKKKKSSMFQTVSAGINTGS